MKFQKLTIHNITSIEDTVIDFEAKPLVDSEVFLITGKTGAGKSTILDSICLALYATTPRFKNTKMQGDTDDGEKKMSIDDPRQLMRRNTGEAFVTLTFTGSNGVHYEATWSVARARKKPDGNMQGKSWQLTNLDNNFTYTKDREIENEIRNAIGLDFNQFCRTTMLAQGEFTRFLDSKDEEKADILEKITGMDIYSKIGRKISEITKEKENDYKEAANKINGITILSDEETDAKIKEIESLNTREKESKSLKDTKLAKRDWLAKNDTLSTCVDKAAEQLRNDNDVVESDDFKKNETVVKEWNETIEVRGWLAEANKATSTIDSHEKTIKNLADRFALLLGGRQAAIREIQEIEKEITATDSFLSAEKPKEPVYKNAQTIAGNLNTIIEGKKTISKLQNEIKETNSLLDGKYIPGFENIKDKETKAKEDLENLENKVKTMEETVERLQLPRLRGQSENLKDLVRNIESAMEFVETLAKEKKRMNETKENLSTRFEDIRKAKEVLESMAKPIEEAKIKMDTTQSNLDKQIDTVNKFAISSRSKLHVGDTCPVCRRMIESEFPHEELLSELVISLKEEYENAKNNYDDLVEKKNKLDANINSESKSYDRDKALFDNDRSVFIAEKKALEACAKCGINSLGDSTRTDLESMKNKTIISQREIETTIKDGDGKEKELKKLREDRDTKRNEASELGKRIKKAEDIINGIKNEVGNKNEIIKTKNDDITKAEGNVASLVSGVTWAVDWRISPKGFAEELTAAAEEYDKKAGDRQTLVENHGKAKTNCDNIGKVIDQILATSPDWHTVEPSAAGNIGNALDYANEINRSVTQTMTQLESARRALSENRTRIDGFLIAHPGIDENRLASLNVISRDKKESVENEVNKGKENVVRSKALLKKAHEDLEEHQKTRPVIDEGETIDELNRQIGDIDGNISEISERRGAINQELEDDMNRKARLGTMTEDRDRKKEVYDKWARFELLLGDATGKKFRKIAQSYVLSSLISSANTYMRTLTDRYTLKVTPGTFVILIEDAYQGYVTRAASTISGGEGFLVSLALALALSDIGQTLSVDTLFIDEGFGTLSGEPLQNAVNTLRSLHTKVGRHVGIISHIEELQERIPVQIQVNQEGNNSSSRVVIVPGEM